MVWISVSKLHFRIFVRYGCTRQKYHRFVAISECDRYEQQQTKRTQFCLAVSVTATNLFFQFSCLVISVSSFVTFSLSSSIILTVSETVPSNSYWWYIFLTMQHWMFKTWTITLLKFNDILSNILSGSEL